MKKVVLVTGGSRGIGLAIVKKFKELGWAVATCATRAESLQGNPADLTFVCDVTQVSQVKAGIQQVTERFGRIDAIINNAGMSGSNPLSPDSSDELWQKIIDINLNGTYYFCKYAGPMLPEGSGRIVNIASVLALKGVADATAYCAAKHGVLGLTRSLSRYFAPKKITVNVVCPSWVRTDMASKRLDEVGMTEEEAAKGMPLGRIIEPNEVADLVVYLVTSPASAIITGQSFTIDGGVLA